MDAKVSILSVRGVTKRFGGITANRGITFDVAAGELVGIIGPNGAGKSTLFECISGFYAPDEGEVELDGTRLTGLSPDLVCRRGIARTFQRLRPFQGMTVAENVMVGALTRTRDVRHAREQAHEWLRRVGLLEKANAHARTLSTGQRKRLELARALATQPRVVLLDEVTGGVDQRSIPALVAQHAGRHRGRPAHRRTAHGRGHRRRHARCGGAQSQSGRGLPRPGLRLVNPRLACEALDVAYGEFQVLWEAGLAVAAGEIVTVLGPNGAGKSTLVNTISGLLSPRSGSITFEGQRIEGMPAHRRAGVGIAHVLERRRLFPFLTVHDNVLLGAHNARARPHRDETLARLEALLPLLKTRRSQLAHTLSGGEQQMVAIARGLMARPKLLMIDEPFLGLAPRMVDEIGRLVRRIRDEHGISVLFIEQNVELSLRLADRGVVLESGRTVLSGPSAELLRSAEVKRIFLGEFAG
jgi:ABC-type branched-subunit amino acid transport system ATPase component